MFLCCPVWLLLLVLGVIVGVIVGVAAVGVHVVFVVDVDIVGGCVRVRGCWHWLSLLVFYVCCFLW